MSTFLKKFREFAVRGNVIDMAVGIIIGTLSAAAFYAFMPLAHAQVASPPCSDAGGPGVPACDDGVTAQVKPIALEQVFVDAFSSGIAWSRTGAVMSDAGAPLASLRAALLCQDGAITKDIPLTNKGNHVLITFRMGAYRLEAKDDPGAPAPSAGTAVARPPPLAGKSMRAEYHDGTTWFPLVTTAGGSANGDGKRDTYAFYLPGLNDPSRFKLRFRIEGSEPKDCGYIDDVAVWTARVVPPPSPAPR